MMLLQEYPPTPETVGKCFQAVVGALNASSSLSQCQLFVRDFVVAQLVGKDLNEIWEVGNTASSNKLLCLETNFWEKKS